MNPRFGSPGDAHLARADLQGGSQTQPGGRPIGPAQNPVDCRLSIRSRSRGIQKSIRDSQLAAQHALEMFRRTLLIGACTQVPRPALQRLTKIGTEARKLRTLWKMGRD